MVCPACNASNQPGFEECFVCGKALFALTQGSVLAARYEIRRLVGHGGMGRVYEAFDRVLEERVAVKVLRPQFAREPDMARRFLSEVRLARRITHANVCRLHEYGESDGIRYLCMELVDGVNLKDVLRTRRLPEAEAYAIAEAAAEGLAAVHAQDVIHRDFKTANIMVDARGQVKVMDFGIAKELGSDSTGISMAGHVLGTPEYMSPEHAQGARLDFRSDIYALACVVFEIFTGRPIFSGGNPIETLRRHLYDPLPFGEDAAPQLPESLRPVLERALAKRPDDRHGSVREFIGDLVDARETAPLADMVDEPPQALGPPLALRRTLPPPERPRPDAAGDTRLLTTGPRPPTPAPRSQEPARRFPWWSGLGVAVVTALAVVYVQRDPEPQPPAPQPTAAPAAVGSTPPPATTLAGLPAEPSPVPPSAAPPRPRPTAEPTRVAPTPAPSEPAPWVAPSQAPIGPSATTPPEAATPEPVQKGALKLLIVPESEVILNGNTLGQVSARVVRLAPGDYTLRIVNPGYQPLQRKITILAGVTLDFVIDLSEKGVRR